MADIREKYDDHTIEEIIQACIDRGVLVPPEALDDREQLLTLLHHDVNDFYAMERTTHNMLLRTPIKPAAEALETIHQTPTAPPQMLHIASQPAPQAMAHRPTAESTLGQPARATARPYGGTKSTVIDSLPQGTKEDPLHPNALPIDSAEEAKRIREDKVCVVKSYAKPARKRSYDDFVKYFNKRYQQLSAILRSRKELQNVVSISRVQNRPERETVAIIGMVLEKKESKSKHTVLTLEDQTGIVEVWLTNNKHELMQTGREIVLDEVIGVIAQTAGNRLFATSVIFPDVPLAKELRKGPVEKYVIFVGDVHIGAKLFLKEEYERFLQWLSGKVGTPEQRELARKTEYVIFIGDLVEGIGIYPEQDLDLSIVDLKEQYEEFTRYLKMIPQDKQIIITTGNHDAGRLQEPQLAIPKDFAPDLYTMPNVTVVSNPAFVTIDKTPTHPGFDILLYHGYSLIYYANNIPPVREAGGQKATEKIMELLLRKRHLSPTHGCNTYVPDAEEDPMVIDRVPDFLVTGHVHRISYANYRGVTMMNVGCWNEQSAEQEKRGLEPQPAKLPIVNLRTRELRIMNFYHGSEEKKQAMREAAGEVTQ